MTAVPKFDDYRQVKPKDAIRYCQLVRLDNRRFFRVFSLAKCWGCMTFSRGVPVKMCGGVSKCSLVRKRFFKEQHLKTHAISLTNRP